MNITSLAAAAETTANTMMLPTFVFPIIAAAFFLLLGIVAISFRDVANRHSQKWADNHGDEAHH